MQQDREKNKQELTPKQLLELPENFAELYVLKQLLMPSNSDRAFYVYQHFQEPWFNS